MNKDFRLSVGFITHPKTVKLRRRIGDAGALALISLFGFTAQNKPDGNLTGMSDEDIAIAAGWDGEPAVFVSALLECRFLDDCDGHFSVHDWAMHNGWAANAQSRSEQSRSAAEQRWNKKRAMPTDANSNAVSMDQHSDQHKSALPNHANSNAPIPSPLPSPSPNPEDTPLTPQGGEQRLPEAVVFLWAPTSDGKDFPITLEKVAEWRATFPRLDVEAEIRRAVQWTRDNGLKTYKGMTRYIGSWLGNAKPSAPITVHPVDPVDAMIPPEELAALILAREEAERACRIGR